MKRIIFIGLILLASVQMSFASSDAVKFILLRMDYLTYQPKHVYYFQQPQNLFLKVIVDETF